jgi:hypothetical protein
MPLLVVGTFYPQAVKPFFDTITFSDSARLRGAHFCCSMHS